MGKFAGLPPKFLSVLLGVLVLAVEAQAKFAPDTEWETVWSEHFRVHSPITYRRFTSRLLANLEEAYQVLSKDLHWQLRSRADIVVRGDIDQPNGFTSVFPYNRIVIHAVPFQTQTSIGEYDDWIRTLAYHELTHLVANDTTNGLFEFGRGIFGSAAKVNLYQPAWIVEGLAVYEETVRSRFGRGRSAYSDMVLRSAAVENKFADGDPMLGVSIDRLNDGVPMWPAGYTPYLYGYVLQEMLAEKGGPDSPGRISFSSSSRVPFFINITAQDVLGVDYYTLWDHATSRIQEIANHDLATIRTTPVAQPVGLTAIGRGSGAPVPSDDGSKIWFVRDSYGTGRGISVLDRPSGKVTDLSTWEYDGLTALRRNGKYLAFSRYDLVDEYKTFADAYLWDVDKNVEIRLTHGARAMEPDFSPDFRWEKNRIAAGSVVYVKNLNDGNQGIAFFDGANEKVEWVGHHFERFSGPAWGRGPFADWVIFSEKRNGANERLLGLHVSTGEVIQVFSDGEATGRVIAATPSFTSVGDLLFVSSRGGVFNVWRIDATALRARLLTPDGPEPVALPLTNFETGAFSPMELPNGRLVASIYSARGFDLAEVIPQPNLTPATSPLKSVHEKLWTRAAGTPDEEGKIDIVDEPPRRDSTDYSVFPSILPKYWRPYAEPVTDGWNLGVITSGFDALEVHQYKLQATWDTRANFPLYQIQYAYDGVYPTIQFTHLQDNKYLSVFGGLSNRFDNTQLQFLYPVDHWSVGLGGTWTISHLFDQGAESGGLSFSIGYSNMKTFPDSIDPNGGELGRNASVQFIAYFAGAEQFQYISATYEERIRMPWKQHFLRLVGNGTHSTNHDISTLFFVGGGETTINDVQNFLLRGYPAGSIYGRSISTFNAEYWIPIRDVFHGNGTLPVYYQRAKARLFLDTGSSEYIGGQNRNFEIWPVGVGVQIMNDVNLAYRLPITLAIGFDWGLSSQYGGEKQVVFGILGRIN